jgi:hypothetical protein
MLASWGLQIVDLALRKGGSSLSQAAPKSGGTGDYGLIALSQGRSSGFHAVGGGNRLHVDRRFSHAAGWLVAGRRFVFGIIHAYDLSSAGIMNKLGIYPELAVITMAAANIPGGLSFYHRRFLRRGRTLKRLMFGGAHSPSVGLRATYNLSQKGGDCRVQPHTFFERYCVFRADSWQLRFAVSPRFTSSHRTTSLTDHA